MLALSEREYEYSGIHINIDIDININVDSLAQVTTMCELSGELRRTR